MLRVVVLLYIAVVFICQFFLCVFPFLWGGGGGKVKGVSSL